jgi:general stress protein 26
MRMLSAPNIWTTTTKNKTKIISTTKKKRVCFCLPLLFIEVGGLFTISIDEKNSDKFSHKPIKTKKKHTAHTKPL